MLIPLLVLNYNGRGLLEECLPSLLRAAAASRHDCRVCVIDNDSTDDSLAFLARAYPLVEIIRRPNQGLCSYNYVLATLACPYAVLLNNDIKLHESCIDPLVAPLLPTTPHPGPPCFMTAPLCWRFDGTTYEGLKTAVRWRWGLVQATSLFPGHERGIRRSGRTASAGAVMAVDREKFLELGGFDPLFLPGRIEDLDFAYRGYLAGYRAEYVSDAVAYHKGLGTFGPAFQRAGCDHLALRNTLLFQWKNLRHPWHVAQQVLGVPVRVCRDLLAAPFVGRSRRWAFCKALYGAMQRVRAIRPTPRPTGIGQRERRFFREFAPRTMSIT